MNLHVDGATKAQFKFNEISSITGVKPYVLRFWESEFDQINPQINELGQKYYSQIDLSAISKIKKLLFDEKLSIPQAKGYLDREMIEDLPEVVESFIKEQSSDLKQAFDLREEQIRAAQEISEQLIEESTIVSMIDEPLIDQVQEKAIFVANEIRNDVSFLRAFKDSDVVSLVSAKKKLSALAAKIDGICKQHNWS